MSNTLKIDLGGKRWEDIQDLMSKNMKKASDNAVRDLESHTKQSKERMDKVIGELVNTQEQANKRQKWMMNGIYGLIFLTVILTLLSALGGGLFEMIGIPKLYDVIGNKMEHTQGIMTLVWYVAYAFIPMVWVGGLGWFAYWIYNRFAR